jgi:hypothetical protein
LVIVDSPPLIISDSFNLASAADAVILVMEPGVTPEGQAKAIKEQLGRANAKILGIVFNKVSEESASSRYDYQYRSLYSPKYYGDYTSSTIKEPATSSRSKESLDHSERGRVSATIVGDVEKAITLIKRLPRSLLNQIGKSRKEGKS